MNKIISSVFRSKGVATIIENPSPIVKILMEGISIEKPEDFSCLNNTWHYHHHEIGTIEDMEKLFDSLHEVELKQNKFDT